MVVCPSKQDPPPTTIGNLDSNITQRQINHSDEYVPKIATSVLLNKTSIAHLKHPEKTEKQEKRPQQVERNEKSPKQEEQIARPGMLFDMFGDMNITELNFEELDPSAAAVDSLLFDNFAHDDKQGGDKIKSEEFSTSSLSCTSDAQKQEDRLENEIFGCTDPMLSSFGANVEKHKPEIASEIEMPLLTLGQEIDDEFRDDINRLSDSASSESHDTSLNQPTDFLGSHNPAFIQAMHNQQIAHHAASGMQQYTQEISPAYYQQQQMLNENLLASMVQPHVTAMHPQMHSHAAAAFYSHSPYASVQHGYHYGALGAYPGNVGSETLGKKGGNSKRYKLTQPSKFCHVCVRSGDQVRLAPCANVTSGLCRKAVCEKCFEKHGFAHEWNVASMNYTIIAEMNNRLRDTLPEQAWTCFHCRSECPHSAQCKIYARTNKRRHNQLKQKKAAKERAAADRATTTAPGAIVKPKRKNIIPVKV